MHGTPVKVAAAYPQSSLNGTPTCRILSGTASYETYTASQRKLDVYAIHIAALHYDVIGKTCEKISYIIHDLLYYIADS